MACGSKRVQRKRISVRLRNGSTATGVEADVCPKCGERYFDLKAMEKLEAEGGQTQ
ncbi:MAG: YgiT-type zinc finger protein [Phycisphaerae bacterium]